ncbi:hypothetical protein RVR34_27635 [Microcystis aeruginosa FBCC-A68]|nr:hypothetical protein [Microcystis aeruginosa]
MWGVGCRVWGVGCGVWGVGCGVWGFMLPLACCLISTSNFNT